MKKTKKKKLEIMEGFCPSCNRLLNTDKSLQCERGKQYCCKCGWTGYWIGKRNRSTGKIVYYFSIEEYQKYILNRARGISVNKQGKDFEERFRSFCKENKVVVQKSNFFAAYMLDSKKISKKIKKKSVVNELKELKKIVKKQKSQLIELFGKHISENGSIRKVGGQVNKK